VNATALGTMSAFFFYAYAPLQLPMGILLDRFGSRYLLAFSALFCAIGCVVFGLSTDIGQAQAGRFCMGIGSAIAFIGMVYICSHWFPKNKLALLVGIGNSIGMLGAAGGVGPLDFVVEAFGWETTILMLGLIGFVLAGVILICIGKEPKNLHPKEKKQSLRGVIRSFGIVIGNWKTWVNSLAALLAYIPTGAFASLWAVPYLERVFHVKPALAGSAASMVFIGWIVGGPLIGWFSDRVKSRRWVIVVTILLTGAFMVPIVYDHHLSIPTIFVFMFMIGFFSSGQLLNFSFAVELNTRIGKGSAIAFTNFVVALGTSLTQPLIGYLLDRYWTGEMKNGLRVYPVEVYEKALTMIPVALAISLILMLFISDKGRIQHTDVSPT
jgi:MFS family permease